VSGCRTRPSLRGWPWSWRKVPNLRNTDQVQFGRTERHRLGDQPDYSAGQILAGTGVPKSIDKVDEPLVDTVFAQDEVRRAERLIDFVESETVGVVQYFGQALGVGEATAALRWCGAPTVDHGCRRGVGPCREDLRNSERVPGRRPAARSTETVAVLDVGFVGREAGWRRWFAPRCCTVTITGYSDEPPL